MSETIDPRPRVMVYVDGFNLYFGVLKEKPKWKWLNLPLFFEKLRPREEIAQVKYFTAVVDEQEHVSPTKDRQKRYLKVLNSCSKIQITLGKYQKRTVFCGGRCKSQYQVKEEKKTDVGIAVAMMSDAMDGLMDRIVLVSGDSDLEPAVQWILKRYPCIKVTVYIPADPADPNPRRNDAYNKMGATAVTLPTEEIPKCQFPNLVKLENGGSVERPRQWG